MSIGSFLASAGQIGEGIEQYQTDSSLRRLQAHQAIAAQDALAREAAVRRDLKMLPPLAPLDMPQLGAPMQLEQVQAQPESTTVTAPPETTTSGTKAGVTPPAYPMYRQITLNGVAVQPWDTKRPDRLDTAGVAGFERIDPNASNATKLLISTRNENALKFALSELSKTNSYLLGGIRKQFVPQDQKRAMEERQAAGDWYATSDAMDYFRRNPEMLTVAQKDPTKFYSALNKTNQRVSEARAKFASAGVREEPAFLAEARNLPAWQQITQGAKSGTDASTAAVEPTSGFLTKVAAAETGGLANPYVSNLKGASSAFGPFQITRGTWVDTYRKLYPNTGLSSSAIWQRRSDPELQNKVAGRLEADNSAQLTTAGVPVNDTTKYLSWFLGSEGAVKLLRSNPNTPVKDVLKADQITANPTILRNKTVGQVVDWAAGKMSGGGAAGGADGATAPVPRLKNSDFYLAKEGAIGSDLGLALRNRQEIARIATIYQQNGMVDQFLNLRFKLMETDSNLLYLQGMQAIQEISALRDPRRLESVYSAYLGSPVRFQPRSDGTWNVVVNGNVVQSGMETGSLINAVRSGIDKQYLADRTKLSSEISMETFKSDLRRKEKAEEQTASAIADIYKELLKGRNDLAVKRAEAEGGKLVDINGEPYLQKGSETYKIVPGEEIPGPNGTIQTAPRLQRVVGVGTSG